MLQFAEFMFSGCKGREVCVKHSPQVTHWDKLRNREIFFTWSCCTSIQSLHWRGTRAQAKDRFMWASFDSVYLDDLSVPGVYESLSFKEYESLSFKELILISRIGLNVRLQPTALQTLICRTCFHEGTLKAGVAIEIKKLKVKLGINKLPRCCNVPHDWEGLLLCTKTSVYSSVESCKVSERKGISPLYFGVVNFLFIFVIYLWGLTWGPYDIAEPIGFSWIFCKWLSGRTINKI